MGFKRALIALPVALTLCACGYSGHHRHMGDDEDPSGSPPPPPSGAVKSTIDADATVAGIAPGQGAGLFIEYQSGGTWTFSATCDSVMSGTYCNWDVIVTVINGSVNAYGATTLDSQDYLVNLQNLDVRLETFTDYETDGFYIDATPGAEVRVDALLDWLTAERYLFWIGGGGLHRGASSNVLELTPSTP